MKNIYIRVAIICIALVVVGTFSWRSALADDNFGSNWLGCYWDNQNFNGSPRLCRTDPAINFNWQTGSPDPAIPGDHFTARWSSDINFASGVYRFSAGADDGIRVAIDGNLIINRWSDAVAGFQVSTADVTLGAGNHKIIVDYYENGGNAGVQFRWSTLSGGGPTATPSGTLTPGAPSSLPASTVRAVVIVELANVRGGPSTSFTPVAQVHLNEVYAVVAQNGANTWFLIQLPNGQRGWIFRRMIYLYNGDWTLLPVLQTPIEPPAPLADVQGVARFSLMVRSAPTTRGAKLGVIDEGVGFKVLKLSRNRAWVFIDADGLQGWVFLPNVKIVFGDLGHLPVSN
jgi:uncharacterized protein YraI